MVFWYFHANYGDWPHQPLIAGLRYCDLVSLVALFEAITVPCRPTENGKFQGLGKWDETLSVDAFVDC